jgi:hypothetical protein
VDEQDDALIVFAVVDEDAATTSFATASDMIISRFVIRKNHPAAPISIGAPLKIG